MQANTEENNEKKSPAKRFLFIFGLAFFAIYLVLGLFIIWGKNIPFEMSPVLRISFGVLLIVYSFFRFTRLLQTRER